MAAIQPPAPDIDPAILDEATNWLVMLQSGEATSRDCARLARWRKRSPAHEAAWRRAEGVLETFRQVPPQLGRDTLSHLGKPGRRQALALLALAVPGAWLAWRHTPWKEWTADLRTATGERKTVALADGTRLALNTATAVNVMFTATERCITLITGEILVTTAAAPSSVPRPFVVRTAQGSLRPLGTRFAVRYLDEITRVTVFAGAVEVRPAKSMQTVVVRAGEQTAFSADVLRAAQPADAGAALWERGMLLARDMRLGDLAGELARYHRGVLRCDPAIADLAVSGAFPVTDVAASLSLLEKTLPVRVSRAASWWITLQAR
ncbi:MAG: FecR domain-containing protein [Candidatus Accumulibacter sp.]|jgi:transmembrane sensor|nr:FecR domain-containing protein [Accumulibacter sp.]